MRTRRATVALTLAIVGLAAAATPGNPATVRAVAPWSIALSPHVLTANVPTDVTVAVTKAPQPIGCIAIDVPAGFTVLGTNVSSVPAGFVWKSAGRGTGPTRITFSTTQDQWRLNGGANGVFIVRIVATVNQPAAWIVRPYQGFTADSQLVPGLVPPPPFAVVPGPNNTVKPKPTPTPTFAPPTASPSATPATLPKTSPSPSPSQTPSQTPSALPSTGFVVGGGEGGPGSSVGALTGPGDGTGLMIGAVPAGGSVQLDPQALGAIGMFAWLVPSLFLSLPGLLFILIVLAQAGFATAFVPVTRGVLGAERRRRARNRSTLPG
jgi:hypothetical protein